MENTIIDVELAKMVFGTNEEMYKKYLFQFIDRKLYDQMEDFLNENKVKDAFEIAHTMKGLVQNLALTEFAGAIEMLVEVMRNDAMPSDEQRSVVKEKYDDIVKYLDYVKENGVAILV